MTEPTLGRRIMIEATICKDAPAGSAMGSKAWTDLRALCARADAAERLAKCCHELNNIDFDDYLEALAAWRALGEVGSA